MQEVIEQDGFEYGARVSNRNMSTCFRSIRYTRSSELEQLIDAVGNSNEKVKPSNEILITIIIMIILNINSPFTEI